MLKEKVKLEKPERNAVREKIDEAKERLSVLQLELKEKKTPVLIVFEGWDAAGKGRALSRVIKDLDPRFYDVKTMDKPSEEEQRRPFLYKYFIQIPEEGKFMFLDGGWMEELNRSVLMGDISHKIYEARVQEVKCMERQLIDNGYIVLKFFFHIDKKEQRKRMQRLLSDKNTSWRVTDRDIWQNRHYEKCLKQYEWFMAQDEAAGRPWYLIDAGNRKWAQLQVLTVLVNALEESLAGKMSGANILSGEVVNHAETLSGESKLRPETGEKKKITGEENAKTELRMNDTNGRKSVSDGEKDRDTSLLSEFPLLKMPKLCEIPLNQKMDEEEYRKELQKCQKKLSRIHNKLYRRKIPVIIAYEGWDAAGKGGNIKRVAGALDPRGCDVYPIASPSPNAKARHYLWRFCMRLPKTGHIAIFDRTWYGRVMVERLEGYCTQDDWKRAYREINEFEKGLYDWGAIIIKFWIQIDKDTQLERFNERQNTPEKRWKITDEDWRNRGKWDQYEAAVDEMIAKTSTEYAPWHILESNDKYYARIKALKIIIRELEDAIVEKS